RFLARFVLRNVTFASIREPDSYDILREIAGHDAPLFLTGDPAVLAPSCDSNSEELASLKNLISDKNYVVGVTITRSILLKAFRGVGNTNRNYSMALDEIAKTFDLFIDEIDAHLVFIPHCIEEHDNRDDRVVARDILERMERKDRVMLVEVEYSTPQLKAFMAMMHAFIGARIHSVINALMMGVPSCTIATRGDVRATGLIEKNFQQGQWIYYVDELQSSTLLEHLVSMIHNRNSIREHIEKRKKMIVSRALLNGVLLKQVATKLSVRRITENP
ncbi:MAG: polysaccharide pyruvyl transferase family protein, partial [Candidatus Heimdallarchaeaceae archaeon]